MPGLAHGFDRHSLISPSHRGPTNPGGQLHSNPPTRSIHVPLLWHAPGTQSSTLISHIIPSVPEKYRKKTIIKIKII